MIQRRDFITLLGGSAAAWPLLARAQQPGTPVVGFLNGNSPEAGAPLLAAFRQGLRDERYVDGENVIIEPWWAAGQYDRLPALAMNLVRRRVAVISAGSPPAAQARIPRRPDAGSCRACTRGPTEDLATTTQNRSPR